MRARPWRDKTACKVRPGLVFEQTLGVRSEDGVSTPCRSERHSAAPSRKRSSTEARTRNLTSKNNARIAHRKVCNSVEALRDGVVVNDAVGAVCCPPLESAQDHRLSPVE